MPTPGCARRIVARRAGPRRCASAACGCRRSPRPGLVLSTSSSSSSASPAWPDDLEAGLAEQPREPLAQDASSRRRGLPARDLRLDDASRAPAGCRREAARRAPRRGRRARAARAARAVRAADAVVGDLDDRAAVRAGRPARSTAVGLRVLGDVRERLRDDVVGGRLDRSGSRPRARRRASTGTPRAVRELVERGARARAR